MVDGGTLADREKAAFYLLYVANTGTETERKKAWGIFDKMWNEL